MNPDFEYDLAREQREEARREIKAQRLAASLRPDRKSLSGTLRRLRLPKSEIKGAASESSPTTQNLVGPKPARLPRA